MRKMFLVLALVAITAFLGTSIFADAEEVQAQKAQVTQVTEVQTSSSRPFDGRLKLEGYAEYINFTGGDIKNSAWGGGILARYLFLDWFGAQTNVTWYGDCSTEKLGGDLSCANWRLSLLLHTYVPDISNALYIYGGGGLGYQFNDDIGSIEIDGALTGNLLAGIGYDLTELLNVEVEVGYQFGNADVKNFTDDNIGLEALFVRLGGGIRF